MQQHLERCQILDGLSKTTKAYWSNIWGINSDKCNDTKLMPFHKELCRQVKRALDHEQKIQMG
jgi:hypothetical protein